MLLKEREINVDSLIKYVAYEQGAGIGKFQSVGKSN